MIKQILNTTLSRILITFGGIGVLLLNTRYLGAEKLGALSLLLVALHFILQITELVGGPALVYIQKKYETNKLLSISYLWSALVTLVAYFILQFIIPEPSLTLIITVCAFIQSINHTHLHLLVGKEKIKGYNLSTVLQMLLFLGLILIFYVLQNSASVITYLLIYLAGQLLTLILTVYFLSKTIINGGNFGFQKNLAVDLYRYGFIIQLANIFQFGVYRINYVILESITSLSTLGIYTLGNQLSEKALIPSKAMSMVQYSKIANSDNKEHSASLTIQLLTISSIIGALSSLALILTPEILIVKLFGAEFLSAKTIFIYLAPGVFFMSISTIYSHYFAGLGKYKFNTITSFIGMLCIALLSYLLIPIYDMKGAAIATSIVYFIQATIQFFIFQKESAIPLNDLLKLHLESLKKVNLSTVKGMLK